MRRTLVAALAVGSVVLAGCSDTASRSEQPKPVEPPPVELAVDQPTADPVKIGVIASLSGEGSDSLLGAEGTQVAAYRLELGGQPVDLEVVDDLGTAKGARAAVEQLVNARVAGIVAATNGDHLLPALKTAAAADTAVVLPYLRTDAKLPSTSWVTGPSTESVAQALDQAMAAHGLSRPFVVTADGVTAPGVQAAAHAGYTSANLDSVVDRVRRAAKQGTIDSAVIAGSAASQAAVVSRLQGAVTELPLVLTPQALSPTFAEQLQESDGTTAAQFVTVGVDATDTTTLTRGDRADAVASYFSALRLLSDSPDAEDLFNSVPFEEVAEGADTASHDAVVALVTAAVEAGSGSAPDVTAALPGLHVSTDDGLAGPALDFSQQQALPADEVVELNATSQDPGVRPGLDNSHLFWFAAPTRSG